jgi:tetratricopeptide (TPR) repeat protein
VAATWLADIPAGHPRYLQAQFLSGLSRYATGDFEAARAAFLTVAATTPVAEVLNNLGAAESRLNLPSALSRFQEALALDAADPDYNFNAGYLLWRGAQFEAAIGHLSRALEAAGEDDEAELLLERARMRSGPRRQDPRTGGLERLKESFPEAAWRQLKLLLSRSGR